MKIFDFIFAGGGVGGLGSMAEVHDAFNEMKENIGSFEKQFAGAQGHPQGERGGFEKITIQPVKEEKIMKMSIPFAKRD